MRALILAAGLGTRLRPLTDKIPKAMVPVGRKPLLWYHIQLLKYYGITDIWINLHWFGDLVQKYFGNGSKFGVKIFYSYEKELLGTSGALKNPTSEIEKEFRKETFLITYGDNLTDFNYQRLIDFHQKKKSFMTIGLYQSREPWTKGVVKTSPEGRIVRMVEKPSKESITTSQVNAGIYVCEKEVLKYIPSGFSDFGFDIIPKLLELGNFLWGLDCGSHVYDIGSMQRLNEAKKAWNKRVMNFPFLPTCKKQFF